MLGVEREEIESDQLGFARRAADSYGAVVLLKGRHTLVARPDGRVRVTTSGVPWLAVAGAGDVLSGVIGSLLAAGLEPFDAASVGSWLHGAAAALASGGGPITAERRGRRRARRDPRPAGQRRERASGPPPSPHAEIVIDLGAIRGNLRRLRELASEGSARPRDDGGREGRCLRARHGAGGAGLPRGRRRVAGRRDPGGGTGTPGRGRHRPAPRAGCSPRARTSRRSWPPTST